MVCSLEVTVVSKKGHFLQQFVLSGKQTMPAQECL